MCRPRFLPRARRGDEGFAMIIAMVIATVSITLITAVLAMGLHLNSSTVRERRWEQALQVAEAGIERAFAKLNKLAEDNPETAISALVPLADQMTPTAVTGGEYAANVTATGLGFQIDAVGYVPSASAANGIQRRIRVTFAPEPSFKYALFSSKSLEVKNDNTGQLEGDVFANEDITIKQNGTVIGSVISSQGWVYLENNTLVAKDADGQGGSVYAGGYLDDSPGNDNDGGEFAIRMDGAAEIEGDAHIQVEATPCTANDSQVRDLHRGNSGSAIGGEAILPGQITGTTSNGPTVRNDCELRFARVELPEFTFQEAAYPGIEFHPWTDFDDGDMTTISGPVYIQNGGDEVGDNPQQDPHFDLACHTIDGSGGDVVIISEVKIIRTNGCGTLDTYVGPSTSTVQIIGLDDGDETSPSIEFGNDFEIDMNPAPAVLVYSRGYCELGNTIINNGAVYCNGLDVQTNMQLSYDPRIEQLVGFGGVLYTRDTFRELTARTPITTTS